MSRNPIPRGVALCLAAWSLAVLTACSSKAPGQSAPSQPAQLQAGSQSPVPTKLTKVKLAAFQSSFVNFPIYVADALKLFQKHGLDVEVIYGTGAQPTNAVVSGAAEFGGFAVENLMAVAGKEQDVRLLVLNQTLSPFTLIVRNAVPLPSAGKPYPDRLKDMKGLKLGISSPGASTDNTLRFLLQEAGLKPDQDVHIVPIGAPDTQIAALSKGQVDGTIAFEPIQTQAIFGLKIAKPVLDLESGEGPDIFKEYAYNGIAGQGKYIDSHRDVARAMVDAIVEAEEFINEPANLDKVVEIAAKSMMGIDKDALRQYLVKYRRVFRPVATRQAIDNVNKVLMQSKRISKPVPYETVVDKLMPTTFKYKN